MMRIIAGFLAMFGIHISWEAEYHADMKDYFDDGYNVGERHGRRIGYEDGLLQVREDLDVILGLVDGKDFIASRLDNDIARLTQESQEHAAGEREAVQQAEELLQYSRGLGRLAVERAAAASELDARRDRLGLVVETPVTDDSEADENADADMPDFSGPSTIPG